MKPYDQLMFILSFGGYWFRFSDKNKFKVILHVYQNAVLYVNVIYQLILLRNEGGPQQLLIGRFIYLPASIFGLIHHTLLLFKRDEYDKILNTLRQIMQTDTNDREKFQKFYNRLRWAALSYGLGQFMFLFVLYVTLFFKELIALIFGFEEFAFVPPMPIEKIMGLSEGRLNNWLKLIFGLATCKVWLLNYSSIIASTHYFVVLTFIEFRIFRYQIKVHHKNNLLKDFEETMRTIISKQCQLARLFEDLKNASSLFLGVQNSIMALNICYFLHIATTIQNGHALYMCIYGFVGFVIVTTSLCILGDLLEEEGVAVYNALYDLPWYELPTQQRRYFTLSLVQARRSTKITYKGILPTNLETYLQIMQASYSYFMFIQSV